MTGVQLTEELIGEITDQDTAVQELQRALVSARETEGAAFVNYEPGVFLQIIVVDGEQLEDEAYMANVLSEASWAVRRGLSLS